MRWIKELVKLIPLDLIKFIPLLLIVVIGQLWLLLKKFDAVQRAITKAGDASATGPHA